MPLLSPDLWVSMIREGLAPSGSGPSGESGQFVVTWNPNSTAESYAVAIREFGSQSPFRPRMPVS